jgi:hypothetical protein
MEYSSLCSISLNTCARRRRFCTRGWILFENEINILNLRWSSDTETPNIQSKQWRIWNKAMIRYQDKNKMCPSIYVCKCCTNDKVEIKKPHLNLPGIEHTPPTPDSMWTLYHWAMEAVHKLGFRFYLTTRAPLHIHVWRNFFNIFGAFSAKILFQTLYHITFNILTFLISKLSWV